jgi:hypothetical protein
MKDPDLPPYRLRNTWVARQDVVAEYPIHLLRNRLGEPQALRLLGKFED